MEENYPFFRNFIKPGKYTRPALEEFLSEISGSVDLLLVERPASQDTSALMPALETQVKKSLGKIAGPKDVKPVRAVIFPNEIFEATELDIFEVGIWDVSNQQGELGWDKAVDSKVFGNGLSLGNTISKLVCTDRGILLKVLTGLTPVLVLLLTLSWVFYEFPRWVKKSTFNLVLWGLLAVVFIVFMLLLFGLPSLDIKDNGVYVIFAALSIPLIFIIWTLAHKIGTKDYP